MFLFFSVRVIISSTLSILSYKQSAHMPIVTFHSLLEMLERMNRIRDFSLRESGLPLSHLVIDGLQSVHWWPGDHDQTKSWTQWDPEGFNSGVASPFLKYASETSTLFSWARYL